MNRLFWKIFLWFWAAIILMTLAAGWGVRTYSDISRQDSYRELPTVMAASLEVVLALESRERATEVLRFMQQHLDFPILVFDAKGAELLGRSLPENDTKSLNPKIRLHMLVRDVQGPDGENYRIVINIPRELQASNLKGIIASKTIATTIALIISALVCIWLARHITRPLKKLRRAYDEFAGGNLDTRLEVPSRRDEIADMYLDFNNMAARVQELIKVQSQMLSDISHELRSPLARMQVTMELAKRDIEMGLEFKPQDEDDIRTIYSRGTARIDRMQKEIERLDSLISQIMTLCKLETARENFEFRQLNFSKLLRDVYEDSRIEARYKKCELVLTEEPNTNVQGNEELLHRAVENIVRNAIYYSPGGTSISISSQRRGDEISLSICDQGPGVDDSQLDLIFEPFIRTDAARERKTGGYGLGMAIAKRAILAHGGTITARNKQPHGLCVDILLPVCQQSPCD
ncbi:MAG: sensor histidine kinase [bacterium]